MYSNNNGESWIESDSNTYTFDNLTDTTEYKIKVKVVDSNGMNHQNIMKRYLQKHIYYQWLQLLMLQQHMILLH